MPNSSSADALIAALNEVDRKAGDDSGAWKSRQGWEREWGFNQAHTLSLIRRAMRAGLMEEDTQYRKPGRISRKTPVYRLVEKREGRRTPLRQHARPNQRAR